MTQSIWPVAMAFVLLTPAIRPVRSSAHPDAGRFVAGASVTAVSIEWNDADRLQPSLCVDCFVVGWCPSVQHTTFNQDQGAYGVGHNGYCAGGTDCSGHPPCSLAQDDRDGVDPERFQLALSRLAGDPATDPVEFVAQYPQYVVLNPRRGSLQIRGTCPAAGLIANLTLSEENYERVSRVVDGGSGISSISHAE